MSIFATMNFKKWLYSLALLPFFTVLSLAEKQAFFGEAELSSATAGICDGNEEFCNTLQEYNTYLALVLLGGEGIVATIRKGDRLILDLRQKVAAEYRIHRSTLVEKWGPEDRRLKALDVHFEVVSEGGEGVGNIPALLVKWDNLTIAEAKSI